MPREHMACGSCGNDAVRLYRDDGGTDPFYYRIVVVCTQCDAETLITPDPQPHLELCWGDNGAGIMCTWPEPKAPTTTQETINANRHLPRKLP